LSDARAEIDALNVFPVPDGDTGTNLVLTMSAADEAAHEFSGDDLEELIAVVARAALLAARGNAGSILSECLRGAGEALAHVPRPAGIALADALGRAADAAYAAVERPVDGTMLTVLRAAADGAKETGSDDLVAVTSAALVAAERALARTPEQLPVLAAAGVVDAGGRGLCVLLRALHDVVTGKQSPAPPPGLATSGPSISVADPVGPAFEVMYLLEPVRGIDMDIDMDAAMATLRERLAAIGDSLLVVGGDGLWNVHVHVDDVGAAIEAGLEAGRPYRIRVTHFETQMDGRQQGRLATRRVVAVTAGDGLVALLEEAGAEVIDAGNSRPSTRELLQSIERTRAAEVVILPGRGDVQAVAEAAAVQARTAGIRVAVIPTTESVDLLAALAVHDVDRPFDDDVIAMTAAARATSAGALQIAQRRAITTAGVVEAGQVIGFVDGEVVAIGTSLAAAGTSLLDTMLHATGELVTLVVGRDCPTEIADTLADHVRRNRPDVEINVYRGQQALYPVLIGVE
jgi:DAK2 domain fusion protein YloV